MQIGLNHCQWKVQGKESTLKENIVSNLSGMHRTWRPNSLFSNSLWPAMHKISLLLYQQVHWWRGHGT